ncbi:MAG TPA: TetR/AcrR family transcriptional regulator [Phenylobacterium sp.]|nr:TetR/AcrR family transcriptional regulator [Phenylobacterium sp.]
MAVQNEVQADEQDGRRQRSADSRARIVAAMLELTQAGEVSPGAEQVAAKADVGLRTVFRHFKDMDSLYREMAEVVEAGVRAVAGEPFVSADAQGKLQELVERRSRVFERLGPFKRAMDVHRHRWGHFTSDTTRMVAELRAILKRELPEALTSDPLRFEALDLLLSFEAWSRLREDQGLDVADARRVLGAAVLRVAGLGDGADAGPR